jgi:hypothetical protein
MEEKTTSQEHPAAAQGETPVASGQAVDASVCEVVGKHLHDLSKARKLAMQSICGVCICFCRIFFKTKIAKIGRFSRDDYLRPPSPPALVKAHASNSAITVNTKSLIASVLRPSCESDVFSFVVQAIKILVVNNDAFLRIQDRTMHQDGGLLSLNDDKSDCINTSNGTIFPFAFLCSPVVSINNRNISSINNCNVAFCKRDIGVTAFNAQFARLHSWRVES